MLGKIENQLGYTISNLITQATQNEADTIVYTMG